MNRLIIFTDLDGTLLDSSTYSFEPALPALRELSRLDIPLILCSSKTRKEIEFYRERLGNRHPFISENGGGIFLPKGYFSSLQGLQHPVIDEERYTVIRLGAHYEDLRKALSQLREMGFGVRGFGDMTVTEIEEATGLSRDEAEMAKERDFDEPFLFQRDDAELPRLLEAIKGLGFSFTEGRFLHILGESDKGKAVSILKGLYRAASGPVVIAALGDSPNDIPMLAQADVKIVVPHPDGRHDSRIDLPGLKRVEGIGPEGWNKAVLDLLKEIQDLT